MIKITAINRNEALRYMGYNKNMDINNIMPMLEECEKRLLNIIKPRFVYRVCDIEALSEGVSVNNSSIILEGGDICRHLSGCEKAVFMAATLSIGVDKLISEYQVKDMSSALICDCMASAAIEQVCDKAEEIIRDNVKGFNMTWRFSPGYGDLSIEYQKAFINVLDAERKIGLTLNSGNILTPAKSVTAIIGLSQNEIPKIRRGCSVCNMNEVCQYRKRGEHCGF